MNVGGVMGFMSNNSVSLSRFRKDEEYRAIVLTIISGIFLLISWLGLLRNILPFDPALISVVISGTPIVFEAAKGLIIDFDIKAGVLVSIAIIASVVIGQYFAAGEIAVIMMIGEILEDRTVRKAKESVQKLIQLTPQVARIRTDAGETEISVEELKIGDILLVKPGESIPVDGIVTKGRTSIDQSIITGESMPVDKTVDDQVFVGTLNQMGVIEVKAVKVGEDTSLSKLIRLVKDAENKKAPVVRLTDKIATRIVPMAILAAIITYMVTNDITRVVTILVVFCPCALVLATPTAIMAGIGNGSRKGILIKSGEALENMGKVDTVIFDKTGTITYGKPELIDVISLNRDYDEENVLLWAARAEKFSEHPLGKAIYNGALKRSLKIDDPQNFIIEPGQGVKASIDGKEVHIGNQNIIGNYNLNKTQNSLISTFENQGKIVLIVRIENSVVGLITLADKIKNKSRETVETIREMGVEDIILLTGDNKVTAASIARQVGITDVHSEQLPDGKVEVIERQLENDKVICMVGDGINDAPALARSSVGVSMGALGADVAIETADIALMTDDIGKIPALIDLSKKVLGTITINIIVPILINTVAVILAAFGIIGPVVGALIHNLGSVLVVANSSRLIGYQFNETIESNDKILSKPLFKRFRRDISFLIMYIRNW